MNDKEGVPQQAPEPEPEPAEPDLSSEVERAIRPADVQDCGIHNFTDHK